MVAGKLEGYRELLFIVGRAAGLSGLALATLASAACCPEGGDECATIEDLVATRDAGVASTNSSGAGGATGSAGNFGLAADLKAAMSWDGTSCPTSAQYTAIVQLKFPNRYVDKIVTPKDVSKGKCCYHIAEECLGGRPFLVNGEQRVASVDGDATSIWLADAQVEHASVAAFARLSLQLLALGAPVELVQQSHLAALDELRHAAFFFELASQQTGVRLRPGALDVSAALHDLSLAALVESNLLEGCIGETRAAADLRRRAELVDDAALRRQLLQIADDETRHAELAFRILAWCRDTAPELTRNSAERVLSEQMRGLLTTPVAAKGRRPEALAKS
ncbi:MAG TPA: ferritin-like domain-containing protein [Polyangiaceae bacterium]|nr:ferritin-like domain-containing protein [Polyangiaceae bacterium]